MHTAIVNKRRIAIDARYVADHFPGIGRYVYNLLTALTAIEHGHTLLVITNPALPNTRHDMAALARIPSIEIIATNARPFTLAEQLQIPRLLRRARADLYHAPYYLRPYVGLPCPAVLTLYDIIPRRFPAEVSPRARLMFDVLTRLAIRTSRRLIAISASARDDMIAAFSVPPERIAVTPLAADPRFQPQPPAEIMALRVKYALPEQYILSLASNKPHKNLPRLVEAFARLVAAEKQTDSEKGRLRGTAPFQLVIAGHWDARYDDARQAVAHHGLEQRVRFLPDIAEADLPALYSGAAIFAFPSLYEGFGLPPLEALACGAPVLCGNTSSLPEVVGDAALMVDPTNSEMIADGLAQLLGDPARREALRAAGRRRAALFSWRATATATLAVYEQALQRRSLIKAPS